MSKNLLDNENYGFSEGMEKTGIEALVASTLTAKWRGGGSASSNPDNIKTGGWYYVNNVPSGAEIPGQSENNRPFFLLVIEGDENNENVLQICFPAQSTSTKPMYVRTYWGYNNTWDAWRSF